MKKEWFFDRFCGEQLVVYAEDGKIIEVGVESEKDGDLLGNIYKGRVSNVVAGMQAAFISCGLERNCYLPLDENAFSQFSKYDGESGSKGTLSLQEGDEILVQVEKLPRGTKGAKVTTALSFVGKTLIYLPKTEFLGISRKIVEEGERARLLQDVDRLRKEGEGFIVRTAAASATKRTLKMEAEYLRKVYCSVLEDAKDAPVGALLYRDLDLPVKVMRDSLGDDVNHIYVGDRELYEKLKTLTRLRRDVGEKKISLCPNDRSMFDRFGLDEQILALASPRVKMEKGAYLVINRTEAMTVIDVNTGKFTGDSDLESTVYETNLLAAREIALQVRLRNISGIIAVDFIDMTQEEHRTAVTEELQKWLLQDRAKCRVQPMTDLCVTLFTRKRTNNELLSFLLKPCPHCTREGYVLSDNYMAMRIRTDILNCFGSGYNAVIIELNRSLMEYILKNKIFSIEMNNAWKDKRVYLIPHTTFHEEQYTVRGDNSQVLTLPDNAQILY
ncbi:MAG: Rne/Rng family ribonuclease [Clostridia bacterium]|nr:Rne/Rng family ribonuclease [Clostridia bacterium]